MYYFFVFIQCKIIFIYNAGFSVENTRDNNEDNNLSFMLHGADNG